MDGNNGRTTQGQVQIPGQVNGSEAGNAAGMEGDDWRTQLQPDSRQRIVNKIMETFKRHVPFSGPEGLQELKKIAVRFEEKTYAAATNQLDYLRKISFKMSTMETRMANSLQSTAASNSKNSPETASQNMQSQIQNQIQQQPAPMISNQSQVPQQLISQNIQDNIASLGEMVSELSIE